MVSKNPYVESRVLVGQPAEMRLFCLINVKYWKFVGRKVKKG